jgi:hypothetical protein
MHGMPQTGPIRDALLTDERKQQPQRHCKRSVKLQTNTSCQQQLHEVTGTSMLLD